MKPDWEKLMKEYDGNDKILIGDVDCTAAGKPLCDSNGVQGFPTIKHGDISDLEDYKGGRDYEALSSFAKSLKPLCSLKNMELCDADQKAEIEKLQAMTAEELQKDIDDAKQKEKDANDTFDTELQKLQDSYKKLQEDKEKALNEVKESGVGLKKAVLASKKEGGAHTEL